MKPLNLNRFIFPLISLILTTLAYWCLRGYILLDDMKKWFCTSCGKKILKNELPWCDKCRKNKLDKMRKVGNNKTKQGKNMYKLQDTPAPEAETPEEETKEEEGTENSEEKTE